MDYAEEPRLYPEEDEKRSKGLGVEVRWPDLQQSGLSGGLVGGLMPSSGGDVSMKQGDARGSGGES